MANLLKTLKESGEITAESKVTTTSGHPPHKGNFFSGWFGVDIDGRKMQVYGSSAAQLGVWEAQKSVVRSIEEYLKGEHPHPPQARECPKGLDFIQ
jgi:hypothetical protein